MKTRSWMTAGAVTLALLAGACGDDGEDRPGQVTSEDGGSGSGSGSGSASGSVSGTGGSSAGGASKGEDGYKPVSDVAPHTAIGTDFAKVKDLLAPAKEGKPVDWAAVRTVITEGGASKRSDGSNRTFEKLVDAPDVVAVVLGAVDGTGASAGAPDTVRAQRVEKGITVLLAAKVRDELGAAAEKVEAKNLEPDDGAPHNVDEAWAFFTAGGNGVAVTADKRAADFKREGKVREPIVAGLVAAQAAATRGDSAALEQATVEVGERLNYVFYLATHKYLDTGGDAVKRAEGESFYLGIQPTVKSASAAADGAIVAAFASGDAAAGRSALHQPAVLEALGVDDAERVDRA
ncbi:MAG TPA: hypothetical protein VNA57_00420 [Acidimicrobiales bacterium]|nr:hypothetical protein [Acidimicrobiales bacterium]